MILKQPCRILVCYTASVLEGVKSKNLNQEQITSLIIKEVERDAGVMREKVKNFICAFYEEECIFSGWAVKRNGKIIATIDSIHPPLKGDIEISYEES